MVSSRDAIWSFRIAAAFLRDMISSVWVAVVCWRIATLFSRARSILPGFLKKFS